MTGPATPPHLQKIRTETNRICDELGGLKGPLLPILNQIQEVLGYVPPDSVPVIAKRLNLSRADVHGVISFYHLYRLRPGGKHTVFICNAEACQSMGALQLTEHAQQALGVGLHETTADGRFTLEPIYCLGNCACAPAMMVDTTLHARVTADSFDQILAGIES